MEFQSISTTLGIVVRIKFLALSTFCLNVFITISTLTYKKRRLESMIECYFMTHMLCSFLFSPAVIVSDQCNRSVTDAGFLGQDHLRSTLSIVSAHSLGHTSGTVVMLMMEPFQERNTLLSALDEKRGPSTVTLVPLTWCLIPNSFALSTRS